MEVTEQVVFFFTCNQCHKVHRQSVKKWIADKGICFNCRYPKVVPGQTSLFDFIGDVVNSLKGGEKK